MQALFDIDLEPPPFLTAVGPIMRSLFLSIVAHGQISRLCGPWAFPTTSAIALVYNLLPLCRYS